MTLLRTSLSVVLVVLALADARAQDPPAKRPPPGRRQPGAPARPPAPRPVAPAPPDAAPRPLDAAAPRDALPSLDAAPSLDAGSPLDAGKPLDAGAPVPAPTSRPPSHAPTTGETTAPPSQSFGERIRQMVGDPTLGAALRAIIALLLFLVGWLIARLLSRGVLSLSRRLLADPRVVEMLGLGSLTAPALPQPGEPPPRRVEEIVAQAVYYMLLLLVAIAVLEIAGVAETSQRLSKVLRAVDYALPLVLRAALTLVIAFLLGRILQKGTVRLLVGLNVDKRFAEGQQATSEVRLSERVGRITFWLIMTFGLVSALEALQIGQLSGPLRRAIERLTDLLPALGAAALILLGGYLFGRLARAVVRNLLEAAGFNRLVARLQLDKPFRKSTPSQAAGTLAMLFVLLQAGIAALNQLELRTLSNPLTGMMTRLYSALPALGLAILIVAIAFVASRLVRGWVDAVLKNVGFDRMMEKIGLGRLRGSAEGVSLPSEVLALATQIAVLLVGAAQALEALELMTWAGYVNAILAFAVERLLVALLIVVLGFGIGTYVRALILARRQDESREGVVWVAASARYAVLVFAFTVAIHQLGVAEHFVRTAFILVFGSLCLALALALGLGGREVAGELVRRQFDRARGKEGDDGR